MSFEVKLEQYAGPLQLLLELIEREQLPITDVSLTSVAQAYLQYVDTHEVASEELADFLIVASKLLWLKSKALLPEPLEEEVGADNLAAQLRVYQQFVDASRVIEDLYASPHALYARRPTPIERAPSFVAPPSITPSVLAEAFGWVLKRLEPFLSLREASMQRVVSVQERIEQLRQALTERVRTSFHSLFGRGSSRADVVVSFLALLELVRQRAIKTTQAGLFEDIALHPHDV